MIPVLPLALTDQYDDVGLGGYALSERPRRASVQEIRDCIALWLLLTKEDGESGDGVPLMITDVRDHEACFPQPLCGLCGSSGGRSGVANLHGHRSWVYR